MLLNTLVQASRSVAATRCRLNQRPCEADARAKAQRLHAQQTGLEPPAGGAGAAPH